MQAFLTDRRPHESAMHTFRSGKYAGKTLVQVMLHDAPHLYRLASVAEAKGNPPHLRGILNEFDLLRKKLQQARVYVRCREEGCNRRAKRISLPWDKEGYYWTSAYFWCDKHEHGISDKSRERNRQQ